MNINIRLDDMKTTLAGIAAILGGLAGCLKHASEGQYEQAFTAAFPVLCAGYGLIVARDSRREGEKPVPPLDHVIRALNDNPDYYAGILKAIQNKHERETLQK